MIGKILTPILNIFRFHKKKIASLIGFFILFTYLLFPFNDLGDLVSTKISELTGGQIFVNFEKLDISLIPQPGLAMENLTFETPMTPSLSAKSLSVAPSISGLLTFKPGVSVHAEKLLGGDVDLTTRGGDKTPAGKMKQKVSLDLSTVSLAEIKRIVSLPLNLAGQISGGLNTQIDPDFVEQPTGDFDFKIEHAILGESNMNTIMGPLPLPKINFQNATLQGRLDKGTFDIQKLVVGKAGGDLFANITGKVDFKIRKMGSNMVPEMGAYELNVKLQVNEATKQSMGMFLGFIQKFQTSPGNFGFKLSAANTFSPPNMTPLTQ